ncbi:MAG: hypothetical protein PSY14_10180 [bacterium]|nr:hypothetical protein [bacterium]
MKNFMLFATAFLLLSQPALAGHPYGDDEQQHSKVMEDIPLMEGMEETVPEMDANNPGQMKEPNQTSATITGNEQMVKSYYNEQLLRKGWQPLNAQNPNVYVNDKGETLRVDADMADGKTVVKLNRTPAQAKPQVVAPAPAPKKKQFGESSQYHEEQQ